MPDVDPMNFADKVILVTGASSGLGANCVSRFIQQGAKVFGIARSTENMAALRQSLNVSAQRLSFMEIDLRRLDKIAQAIDQCVDQFGKLDVLINVDGKHHFRHTPQMELADWQEDIAVNLSAPFILCQRAIPHLLATRGTIINVSSIAGLQGQPYSAAYCAAKHGLLGLTKALAMEYMKSPIRINAVCPGGMDTPQVQNIQIPENADFDLVLRASAPRGLMQADGVARVIEFLASSAAESIHGAVLTVDDGKTVG